MGTQRRERATRPASPSTQGLRRRSSTTRLITYSVGGKQFVAVAAGDDNPTYKAKGDNAIVIALAFVSLASTREIRL